MMRGELVLDAHLADRLPSLLAQRQVLETPGRRLSSRELEILTLVAQGLGNAEIGGRLFLAEKTVRNNITAILAKTGMPNRPALIALARDRGV